METKIYQFATMDGPFGYTISIMLKQNEIEELNLTPEGLRRELESIFEKKNPIDLLKTGTGEYFFKVEGDISLMYVDHLCDRLEKRSILDIVIFLSRYCGWDRIKNQMDAYVQNLERGSNG